MTNWKEALKIQAIAQEFADVGENLLDDLSGVHMQAVLDVHEESAELEIFIFGKDNEENEPPVVHVLVPMSCGIFDMDALLPDGSVNPEDIFALFEPEFLDVLGKKKLYINWNIHWPTQANINPLTKTASSPLFPQEQ